MASIKAKNLSLHFPNYENDRSFKKLILKSTTGGLLKIENKKIIVSALNKLNFEINDGERIGLYGHNGSGKTSLLRVIAGAYFPTDGEIIVNGKVTSLIDITLGFEGNLNGIDNIKLRGLMLGMTPKEIDGKMDKIISYSGLGNYIYMPIKNYSSGMQMRLAFSVSTSVDADILLLDEWLSVGDESFQKIANKKITEIFNRTSIIVIASHSKELLNKNCDQIFVLDKGEIKKN